MNKNKKPVTDEDFAKMSRYEFAVWFVEECKRQAAIQKANTKKK